MVKMQHQFLKTFSLSTKGGQGRARWGKALVIPHGKVEILRTAGLDTQGEAIGRFSRSSHKERKNFSYKMKRNVTLVSYIEHKEGQGRVGH